jgi:hypothetical protein
MPLHVSRPGRYLRWCHPLICHGNLRSFVSHFKMKTSTMTLSTHEIREVLFCVFNSLVEVFQISV